MQDVNQAADALLAALRATEEYARYERLKLRIAEDEGESALLRRFLSAQAAVQMSALAGREAREEDMTAFEALSSLVYQSDELSEYLTARMSVQRLVAKTLARITRAADMEVELPEC